MTEHQVSRSNIDLFVRVIHERILTLDRLIYNEEAELKTPDGVERAIAPEDRQAIRDQIWLYEQRRRRAVKLAILLGINNNNPDPAELTIEKILLALLESALDCD